MVLPFSVIQKNRRRIRGRISKDSIHVSVNFPGLIKLDGNLREILESEAKPNERYNETILRLFRERTDRIEKLDYLNRELGQKIEQYRALTKDKEKKERNG
jgi:hypothetical protein